MLFILEFVNIKTVFVGGFLTHYFITLLCRLRWQTFGGMDWRRRLKNRIQVGYLNKLESENYTEWLLTLVMYWFKLSIIFKLVPRFITRVNLSRNSKNHVDLEEDSKVSNDSAELGVFYKGGYFREYDISRILSQKIGNRWALLCSSPYMWPLMHGNMSPLSLYRRGTVSTVQSKKNTLKSKRNILTLFLECVFNSDTFRDKICFWRN